MDSEKQNIGHAENIGGVSSPSDQSVTALDVWPDDDPRMKKLLRKVDIRICLSLGLVYFISLLDRTNLGNASIAGMSVGLNLTAYKYNIIVLAFFPPYIVFQVFATVVTKKMGPRIFLAAICILWGVTELCFGFVHKWTEMVGLRILLGILESGLFPGAVFLLSTWYKRHEVAVRNSLFYMVGSITSSFGGILAYGLMQIQTKTYAGWRWIFIIEGIMTIVIGIFAYFALVDFPDKALESLNFLTAEEVKMMNDRVELDRHDSHTPPFNLKEYLKCALDWKIWPMALCFGATTTVTYAVAYFLPIILREGLGFDLAESQCLSTPLYVAAGIVMYVESKISDRIKIRAPFLIFNGCMSIVGLVIMGFAHSKAVKYFGCYLLIIGANANIPFALTLQQNNIVGQWKRAFCSGTIVGFGGIGGIAGSLIFRTQDKPEYKFGLYACMLAAVIQMLCVAVLTVHFIFENRKQAKGKVLEGTPGFRFTY